MRRTLAALVFAATLTMSGATPAAASCAAPPPMAAAIEDAAAVFVGTVRETTNGDRWATVEVAEVWKGDVEALVEVQAGPEDPPGPMGVASSVDRTFAEGKTYLFLPHAGKRVEFEDSSCSRTTVYREELERFRPAGAFSPAAGGDTDTDTDTEGGSSGVWWAVAAMAGLVVAAVAVAARKRTVSDS